MESPLLKVCGKAHHRRVTFVPVHHPPHRLLTAQLHSRHFSPHSQCHNVLDCLSDILHKSGMATSCHISDTYGLTSYEPNLMNSVGRKSKSLRSASCLWTDFIKPPGEVHITSQRKRTPTKIIYIYIYYYTHLLARQRVYWQERRRNGLNFQQAGFERAAQEYEQAHCSFGRHGNV